MGATAFHAIDQLVLILSAVAVTDGIGHGQAVT